MWVRLKHDLPRPKTLPRQCEPVEELPYGEQAQVDFGQQNQYDEDGNRVKVFFMIMVLSRSRQKFIWFTNQSLTTLFVIEAHEKAFAFFCTSAILAASSDN
jgi:transposase